MSIADKMWDAITTVIRMNDNVERLAGAMKTQQERIENLTERIIRLETALEIALLRPQGPKASARRLTNKGNDRS